MKIGITGAFGSVGKALLEELLNRDHEIRIFELKNSKNWWTALKYKKKGQIQWGNIVNYKDVKKFVKDMDAIVHLAAIIPPLADNKPKLAKAVNVMGTKNVVKSIEHLAKRKRPKLLYTSSIAIYGDRRQNPNICTEDVPCPNEEYGRQKLEAEKIVKDSKLDWTVFRLSYITALDALKMNPLMFEMPLDTKLEICDPNDVALAIANGLERDDLSKEIFNIAGGNKCRTTYKEYLENMMRLFGMGGALPEEAFSSDEFHCGWMLDSERANQILDFQTRTLKDYYKKVKRKVFFLRSLITLFRPLARKVVLGFSKHYKSAKKSY